MSEGLKLKKSQNISGHILCLHDINIHTNFHQNLSINEYATKKKAKIP